MLIGLGRDDGRGRCSLVERQVRDGPTWSPDRNAWAKHVCNTTERVRRKSPRSRAEGNGALEILLEMALYQDVLLLHDGRRDRTRA